MKGCPKCFGKTGQDNQKGSTKGYAEEGSILIQRNSAPHLVGELRARYAPRGQYLYVRHRLRQGSGCDWGEGLRRSGRVGSARIGRWVSRPYLRPKGAVTVCPLELPRADASHQVGARGDRLGSNMESTRWCRYARRASGQELRKRGEPSGLRTKITPSSKFRCVSGEVSGEMVEGKRARQSMKRASTLSQNPDEVGMSDVLCCGTSDGRVSKARALRGRTDMAASVCPMRPFGWALRIGGCHARSADHARDIGRVAPPSVQSDACLRANPFSAWVEGQDFGEVDGLLLLAFFLPGG